MKKHLKEILMGIVIIVALAILIYSATRDRSTVEFINGNDYSVFVTLLSKNIGKSTRVDVDMRPNSTVHVFVKSGQYAVFYKTDTEEGRGREKHIRIEEGTRYKFTEVEGELVFNDRSKQYH